MSTDLVFKGVFRFGAQLGSPPGKSGFLLPPSAPCWFIAGCPRPDHGLFSLREKGFVGVGSCTTG